MGSEPEQPFLALEPRHSLLSQSNIAYPNENPNDREGERDPQSCKSETTVQKADKTTDKLADRPTDKKQSNGKFNVSVMPWLGQAIIPMVSEKPKKVVKILYPQFQECIQYINDDYWKKIFEEASHGKFPRNFIVMKNSLAYRKRKKIENVQLPENTHDLVCVCIEFFRSKGGIRSPDDQEREKKEQIDRYNDIPKDVGTWSSLGKNIRKIYISEYVDKLAVSHKLNAEDQAELKTMIYIGFFLGYVTNDSVSLNAESIDSIEGIDIKTDPITRRAKFQFTSHPTKLKKLKNEKDVVEETTDQHLFYKSWCDVLSYWIPLMNSEQIIPRTPSILSYVSTPTSTPQIM